jgi:hypothetical protein
MGTGILFIIGAVVFVLLAMWAYDHRPSRMKRLRELEKQTELVKCWIIGADQSLYDGSNKVGGPCKVLFSLSQGVDEPQMLSIAERLAAKDESFTAKKSDFGTSRVVPQSDTDGLVLFTSYVWVSPKYLPEGKLSLPYIMCKVCVSESREPLAGAAMVAYAESAHDH